MSLLPTGKLQRVYDPNVASMEALISTCNQWAAAGFIRLNALPLKVRPLPKNA
jgi:hypothetical protein